MWNVHVISNTLENYPIGMTTLKQMRNNQNKILSVCLGLLQSFYLGYSFIIFDYSDSISLDVFHLLSYFRFISHQRAPTLAPTPLHNRTLVVLLVQGARL